MAERIKKEFTTEKTGPGVQETSYTIPFAFKPAGFRISHNASESVGKKISYYRPVPKAKRESAYSPFKNVSKVYKESF